jgi:hypothetical protein
MSSTDSQLGQSDYVIRITPASDRFDPNSASWEEQVQQLYKAIQASGGALQLEKAPKTGTKGELASVLLILSSPVAVKAAVDIFQAWLKRDRSRRLTLSVTKGDETTIVDIDAETTSDETIQLALHKMLD